MIDWTRLTPAVERAAGIAKSNFPAHHSVSDVKQEIWVWIMENKNTVTRILGESNGENVLIGYLVRAAQTHLKTEDAQFYGYAEEDKFFYSLDLIKSILEVVFTHEDWQSFATALDAMPRGKQDPSHSGNNLASYSDVKSAIEHLPEDHYNIMVWRYKYRETFAVIGEHLNITRQAAQQRHEVALGGIQAFLGQRDLGSLRNGFSGRTEPSTNASADARTIRDYEG
jgi:hypothetical protein